MENIKEGIKSVGEKAQSAASGASYEANKEVAKEPNLPVGTRAQAAKDAVGDKLDQTKHDVKQEYHKQKATH